MSSMTTPSSCAPTSRPSTPQSDEPESDGDQSKPDVPETPRSSLFSRPTIEVAVRSADGTEFYVPRQFLVDASPVLEALCTAAAPALAVDLPEVRDAVETLLVLCHPHAPEPAFPESFDASKPALLLGWKYELRGEAHARARRVLEHWLVVDPVVVYVFAAQPEDERPELLAEAARACLLEDWYYLARRKALDAISTRVYRRLVAYREACVGKMRLLERLGHGPKNEKKWVWQSCHCLYKDRCGSAAGCKAALARAEWFDKFYAGVLRTLQATPHPDAIRGGRFEDSLKMALQMAARCPSTHQYFSPRCSVNASHDLPGYLEGLAQKVDEMISEVTF
ncbi:hypothetical protein VTO73DRAFT_2699 [Trametes versicolor]